MSANLASGARSSFKAWALIKLVVNKLHTQFLGKACELFVRLDRARNKRYWAQVKLEEIQEPDRLEQTFQTTHQKPKLEVRYQKKLKDGENFEPCSNFTLSKASFIVSMKSRKKCIGPI